MSEDERQKTDWLRNVIHACVIISFFVIVGIKLADLLARNTAMREVQRSSPSLLFPSITACPIRLSDMLNVENKVSKST